MKKRWLQIALACVAVLMVVFIGLGLWVRGLLTGSLPQVDGQIAAKGLSDAVTIERDKLGIPTIRAANRNDLAFATGFAHAQDRFFLMDLLRRNSAGELAEVVGKAVLPADRKVRVHQFRQGAGASPRRPDPSSKRWSRPTRRESTPAWPRCASSRSNTCCWESNPRPGSPRTARS